ncbi:hypothetical protein PPL_11307 [Heterostelium album PN500]|uniref:Uncharacterized protein n=1 Tax=Heterostelium pallidum (strain ATCC 26659 / Pp 5 / PN500) TaxID=670386 RepID=D3BU46_HETP5|nr:hypothetical protein PPL_11307 [Heterostelium album PN500]EFA75232.1 hypothetical protein PPL_11307 [Heterostelium album PN500]|eukprot:XP_020427366.1 hypothetical protein PPL_11307 [Heterostelium album PN500]
MNKYILIITTIISLNICLAYSVATEIMIDGLANAFTDHELNNAFNIEILKHLQANYDHSHQVDLDPTTLLFSANDHHSIKSIIGGKSLAKNKEIIHHYHQQRKSIILVDVDQESKSIICSIINGCSKVGNHRVMAFIPKKTSMGISYHVVFNWVEQQQSGELESRLVGNNNVTFVKLVDDGDDQQVSSEPIVKHLVGKLTSNGDDDGPVPSLIPPSNTTIPFGYIQTVEVSQFAITIAGSSYNGQQQVFSRRLDNNYYIYKDNVNKINNFALIQNGFVYPGSSMIVNDPNNALGFSQYQFSFNNEMTYNGEPLDTNFNLQSTSPPTVDQTHVITNVETTSTTITISFSIDSSTGSGGGSYSETWTEKTSSTQQVSDWGVNEQTDPASMSTGWVYHQQLPTDIYTLGYLNFGTWWAEAYDQGQIRPLEPLSTSTLQTSTSSVWSVDSSLIDPTTDELVLDINLSTLHCAALIANPGFFDSHHKLVVASNPSSLGQSINVNYFNFNTKSTRQQQQQ